MDIQKGAVENAERLKRQLVFWIVQNEVENK
jgi:hypothetical protein